QDLAKLLGGVTVTIAQKAGESDQLFGSVTAKDIAEALEKQNFTIDRRKIQLDEPIKQLGEHRVTLRLHREVPVEVTVQVGKEKERGRWLLSLTGKPPSSPARPRASAKLSRGDWRKPVQRSRWPT